MVNIWICFVASFQLFQLLPEICFGPPQQLLLQLVGWKAHVDVFAVKQVLNKCNIQPLCTVVHEVANKLDQHFNSQFGQKGRSNLL